MKRQSKVAPKRAQGSDLSEYVLHLLSEVR